MLVTVTRVARSLTTAPATTSATSMPTASLASTVSATHANAELATPAPSVCQTTHARLKMVVATTMPCALRGLSAMKSTTRCKCKTGYYGNGKLCEKIDPCAYHNCGDNADCIANGVVVSDGDYECKCREGYAGNGFYCEVYVSPCDGVTC